MATLSRNGSKIRPLVAARVRAARRPPVDPISKTDTYLRLVRPDQADALPETGGAARVRAALAAVHRARALEDALVLALEGFDTVESTVRQIDRILNAEQTGSRPGGPSSELVLVQVLRLIESIDQFTERVRVGGRRLFDGDFQIEVSCAVTGCSACIQIPSLRSNRLGRPPLADLATAISDGAKPRTSVTMRDARRIARGAVDHVADKGRLVAAFLHEETAKIRAAAEAAYENARAADSATRDVEFARSAGRVTALQALATRGSRGALTSVGGSTPPNLTVVRDED